MVEVSLDQANKHKEHRSIIKKLRHHIVSYRAMLALLMVVIAWAGFMGYKAYDLYRKQVHPTPSEYMRSVLVVDIIKHYEITPEMTLHYEILKDIRVTPYTNRECETDSTPNLGAEGKMVCEGTIAISQDLYRKKVQPGDIVYVKRLNRYFEALDTMNVRHKDSCDVFFYKRRLSEIMRHAVWGKTFRTELHILRLKK